MSHFHKVHHVGARKRCSREVSDQVKKIKFKLKTLLWCGERGKKRGEQLLTAFRKHFFAALKEITELLFCIKKCHKRGYDSWKWMMRSKKYLSKKL